MFLTWIRMFSGRMAGWPAVGHFILILIGYEYERTKLMFLTWIRMFWMRPGCVLYE
jgi:hypothetical protein